jgi:hypothetical protein
MVPVHEGGFTGRNALSAMTALTKVPVPCIKCLAIFNTTHKKLKANWVQ